MNGLLFISTGILICFISYVPALQNQNQIWNWKCDTVRDFCTRRSTQNNNTDETLYPSLEICRLICGEHGGLWPRPANTLLSNKLYKFGYFHFDILTEDGEVKIFLEGALDVFKKLFFPSKNISTCPVRTNALLVQITVQSNNLTLDWNTNEGYSLKIKKTENQLYTAKIASNTVFGARHALQTLAQLIEFYPYNNGSKCLVTVDDAEITDSPVFPHRGLLLDTARNFQSIPIIKRHIDAMGASKLNVLHWHITDSQSFPLELPSLPNMTKYGAYSVDKIYHSDEIKELLSYAKLRGVRILIEIDAPAHSGNGWQWGKEAGLGNLAVCVNQQPFRLYCIQPPCGQLNPVNPSLYNVLQTLYSDIVNMLPKGEILHMGGDEVYIPCWNSTPEILEALGDKPRTTETFLDLWSTFQAQALGAYDRAVGNNNTPIILWTSHLTETDVIEKYLPKERYVIQTWVPAEDSLPQELLALGYRVIISTKNAWYLDHGFWGTTTYYNWQTVYNNIIPRATIGGEVCMWGEYVDDSSVESRTWPRGAAAAERLWSDPTTTAKSAMQRFYRHRERLVSMGINAEAVLPKWCYQNEGAC